MDLLLDLNGLPTGLPYYLLSCKREKRKKEIRKPRGQLFNVQLPAFQTLQLAGEQSRKNNTPSLNEGTWKVNSRTSLTLKEQIIFKRVQ